MKKDFYLIAAVKRVSGHYNQTNTSEKLTELFCPCSVKAVGRRYQLVICTQVDNDCHFHGKWVTVHTSLVYIVVPVV